MPDSLLTIKNIAPLPATYTFCWEAMRARSNAARRASVNRAQDYLRLSSRPDILRTHLELNEISSSRKRRWTHYDYGEGYFYQSLAELGKRTAFHRRTLNAYQLLDHVRGKTVLDIGCNAGFLSVSLAKVAHQVTGFDVNPFLVAMGRIAARAVGRSNAVFLATGFENADLNGPYDVVMSLANHSTFDGQTQYNLHLFRSLCFIVEAARPVHF